MASGTQKLQPTRRTRGHCDAPGRAHDAGLRLKPVDNQLLVEGPKRAEPIVRLLAAHKAEIMAALTENDNRATLAPKEPLAATTDAEYWRLFFGERAAHREYDGGYSGAEAERLAFGEMLLEWHRRQAPAQIHLDAPAAATMCLATAASSCVMVLACISTLFAASIASPPMERNGGVPRWRRCASRGSSHRRGLSCGRNWPRIVVHLATGRLAAGSVDLCVSPDSDEAALA